MTARGWCGGVAGFVAEGGGGLEAGEAEEGEDDAETDSGGSDGVELELGQVDVGTVAQEQGGDDENDYGDGGSLDPEHEAGGGLDVAIGEGGRRGGGAESDDRAGDGMGLGDEDSSVVEEAADDRGSGGDVGEQQCPARSAAAERRKQVGGELIERAGRG